jgi:hypothetical protein
MAILRALLLISRPVLCGVGLPLLARSDFETGQHEAALSAMWYLHQGIGARLEVGYAAQAE